MKRAIALAFATLCAAVAACAAAPVGSAPDAPHPSDACIILGLGQDASLGTQLDASLRPVLAGIATQSLPTTGYVCGDVTYQTDPQQRGLTYTALGFSADHRAANLVMQSVAGPLAGAGYRCLFQKNADGWALRGCQMEWIS